MKTRFLFLISMLTSIILFAGCDDEQRDLFITDTFEGVENEEIVFELVDIPAYVTIAYGGYVSIYYSEYADEYFVNKNYTLETMKDIQEKRIGVELTDFNTYGIPFYSKVYISASVTNKGRFLDEAGEDWAFGGILPVQRKGYLKKMAPRD